jgi:hypothetical protein
MLDNPAPANAGAFFMVTFLLTGNKLLPEKFRKPANANPLKRNKE